MVGTSTRRRKEPPKKLALLRKVMEMLILSRMDRLVYKGIERNQVESVESGLVACRKLSLFVDCKSSEEEVLGINPNL